MTPMQHNRRARKAQNRAFYVAIFALLGEVALLLGWNAPRAATPQPIQMCTVAPAASGGLLGCPSANVVMALPKNPTDRLRAQVGGHQQWLPYSAVTGTTILYGGTPAQWQQPAALGLAILPATPQPPPPVTPPPPTCPKDTIVSLNWSCSIANATMTCTAPVQ